MRTCPRIRGSSYTQYAMHVTSATESDSGRRACCAGVNATAVAGGLGAWLLGLIWRPSSRRLDSSVPGVSGSLDTGGRVSSDDAADRRGEGKGNFLDMRASRAAGRPSMLPVDADGCSLRVRARDAAPVAELSSNAAAVPGRRGKPKLYLLEAGGTRAPKATVCVPRWFPPLRGETLGRAAP